jgi:hypothetical protein
MKQLLHWRRILVVATACALTACGSSGSGGSSSPIGTDPPPPSGSNTAPTISGSPVANASVGVLYSFQPTASDSDGDSLTFSVTNLPSWASFTPSSGRISGTPTSSLAGLTFSGIVVSVSDGKVSTSLPSFSIAVAAPNRAPTITGTPAASVIAGQAYSFQPTASDPENQRLTFSIVGLPAWADFSTTTGRLSGTPTSADVRTYSGIVIRVTDGATTVPLPTFSITVTAAGTTTGSATLRWTPPTLNEDGTPIENLAGYRVYYGTSTGNLNQVVTIASPSVTSAVIQNLAPATWYFALKAYNAANVESSFSNIASKTIH